MPIDWSKSHLMEDGICRVEITHSMNGLFDDVQQQGFRLLYEINDFLASKMACVGLLSHNSQAQPNTKLGQKFGFWGYQPREINPALYFSVAFDVMKGIFFFGGVMTEKNNFEAICTLGQQVYSPIFFWSERNSELKSYVESLVTRKEVFVLNSDGRSYRISYDVLADICRNMEGCICIPDLSIDTYEADFIVIDPLKMLGTCCDEFICSQMKISRQNK
jgi:hypothetical protein